MKEYAQKTHNNNQIMEISITIVIKNGLMLNDP